MNVLDKGGSTRFRCEILNEQKERGAIVILIKVMFVCHGNICRSPMAEFVLKDMIEKRGLGRSLLIDSSATSTEEIGNPVHVGTKNKLKEFGISTEGKRAVQLCKKDYDKYDYLIGMDKKNIINMRKILGGDPNNKIFRFLDISKNERDIADPWYTGDFDRTYNDIFEGCEAFCNMLNSKKIM